jgi:lysozyme
MEATIDADLAKCGAPHVVHGIDVSTYQGAIKWSTVDTTNKQFAFVRVANGETIDDRFDENWVHAKNQGVIRGAYQYFEPGQGGYAQADTMIDHIRKIDPLGDDDLPPVVDVETFDGQPRSVVITRLHHWLDRVERRTGRRPIIYSGYFWQDLGDPDGFARYPLWVPRYGGPCPEVRNPWSDWTLWQYASGARVDGIPDNVVDVDVFQGTMSDLRDFIHKSHVGAPVGVADGQEVEPALEESNSR